MRQERFTLTVCCKLAEGAFTLPFDELAPELQELFERYKTNCGEGGDLGSWCDGCPFCILFEEDEE